MSLCKISDISSVERNELYAEINTAEWLESVLDRQTTLESMFAAWCEAEEKSDEDHAEFLEVLGYKQVAADNSCNSENDFSSVFNFYVYQRGDSKHEWYYDDDAIVALAIHRGGDVRGNYGAYQLYKGGSSMGEGLSSFLDYNASWHIEKGVDEKGEELSDDDMRGVDEKWECGYSHYPTGRLRDDIEVVHCIGDNTAEVTLKNGWRVTVGPSVMGC
jgi:hypothetical protein